MPYNGSGSFSVYSTLTANTRARAADLNTIFSDFATGLSTALPRDGQASMTGVFKSSSGSVSAPAVSWDSETTSGWYRAGTKDFRYSVNGADVFKITDTGVTVTGALTCSGAVSGTFSIGTSSITANAVTNAKLATMANNTVKGNLSGGTADPSDVTMSALASAVSGYLTPAVQPSEGVFSNLKVEVTTGTAATVSANVVVTVNGSNAPVVLRTVSCTINTASTGANGLDTGSMANSTWYAVWVIYNSGSTTTAAMLSTSGTSPTMPSGYTYKARVGWVRSNGSAQLVGTIQYGRKAQYKSYLNITSGNSGNVGTPTWTAISVSGFVPTTASEIILTATLLGTSSNAGIMVAPNSSYGAFSSTTNTPPIVKFSLVSSGISIPQFISDIETIVLESTNIYYASSASDGYLNCLGWVDNL